MADKPQPKPDTEQYAYLDDLSPSAKAPEDVTGGSTLSELSTESEIVSPRDPASGLPTGKRVHKPFSF